MKKCKFSEKIDDYLLGKLSAEEAESFEKHYFECPACFSEMTLRNEIINVVRQGMDLSPRPVAARAARRAWSPAGFSPAKWAVAGISVVLLLVVGWLVVPRSGQVSPQFVLNSNQVVRGTPIQVISPKADLTSVPDYMEWREAGENLDYRVTISNGNLLWSLTTKETRITIPEGIKKLIVDNTEYSWQVKAFDQAGTLTSASIPTAFKVKR